MSRNELPENFKASFFQLMSIEEKLEIILNGWKEKDKEFAHIHSRDLLRMALDIGVEQAIEDYYDAEYR